MKDGKESWVEDKDLDVPFVSALLVTRNEQDYVEMAFLSLVEQDYPKDRYEIIVVDGGSTDETLLILKGLKKQYEGQEFSIRILDNPKHILAAGWNMGIQAAKGEYVIRIDAHAKAEPSFLRTSVKTIQQVDAVCVGGKLLTKTWKGNDETISKVLSSPFGVGNSSFRVSDKAGYVDTAVYGLYRKDIFEKVGYFSEKYVRNQDLQLHSRIRKAGGTFYFNPEIRCAYYTRNTTRKMLKQAFQNGRWNMVLMKEDCSGLSMRHLVPFVFVCFLVAIGGGGVFWNPLWGLGLSVIVLHLILGVIFGWKGSARGLELVKMPILFFLLHTAYGAGYLAGLLH